MDSITLNAHAKINLSLEVVGRRPDGYHNIVSLMQGIGLCDVVTIKKCPQNGTKYNLPHCTINRHVVYLCTNEKTIPTDMNNLAIKGIAALAKASETVFPGTDLIIGIEKKLPVAAGIAGGSGNAAASMLGLNALAGYPLSLRELMSIGAEAGADVPFSIFMNAAANRDNLKGLQGLEEAGFAAWTGGIGDIVEGTDEEVRHVIMANPGTGVSTRDAYQAIDSIGYSGIDERGSRKLFVNDLEKYTLESYPEAAALKQLMRDTLDADEILMSGSGPTMVAYYKDKDKAERDAERLTRALKSKPGHRMWLTTAGTDNKTQEERQR